MVDILSCFCYNVNRIEIKTNKKNMTNGKGPNSNPDIRTGEDIITQNGGIPLFSENIKNEIDRSEEMDNAKVARLKIEQLMARGYMPYLVVSEEDAENIKQKGLHMDSYLKAHSHAFIFLGVNPHISPDLKGKNLVYICINDYVAEHFNPRLAGEGLKFRGTVSYSQQFNIPPEYLHFVKAEEVQELEGVNYYDKGNRKGPMDLPPINDAIKERMSVGEKVKGIMS